MSARDSGEGRGSKKERKKGREKERKRERAWEMGTDNQTYMYVVTKPDAWHREA